MSHCPGLRPTPDRVRETLFNWLMSEIDGSRCLDLFAGTGALGFEAASRGAREVVMVESDPRSVSSLEQNLERLGAVEITIRHCDARTYLHSGAAAFDVVFLDPPFGEFDLQQLCFALSEGGLLASRARVYLESDASIAAPAIPGEWTVLRSGRAGRVRYDLATPGPHGAD